MDINQLIKEAMLAKDSVRLSSLRAIKSAFLVAQTEKGAGELDEAAKQKIIQKQVKQRKDAARRECRCDWARRRVQAGNLE